MSVAVMISVVAEVVVMGEIHVKDIVAMEGKTVERPGEIVVVEDALLVIHKQKTILSVETTNVSGLME